MKIELLFPELVTLYGENGNLKFLEKCLPDAEVIKTAHGTSPAFVGGDVDIVYIGSMIDNYMDIAIEALRPYLSDLQRYIDSGRIFLATGNAMNLFGKEIRFEDRTVEALGLFDFYSVSDVTERHNSWFLGEFEDIKITAFRSTFLRQYGSDHDPFIKVLGGSGRNAESKIEGVRKNNFYATSLLGPFLVINPLFTKYLLKQANVAAPLWNEDAAMEAYRNRLCFMEENGARFEMGALG